MLAPSEQGSKPWPPRPFRQTLPAAAVVIVATVLGTLILYFGTHGLLLLAHQVP
jgi:hypothetical protein